MATKYTKDIYWLVGNSKNLPIVDHSLDFITALFTVVNQNELKRALKPRLDFKKVESYDLIHQVKIDNREDALNLLKMTPHYYHIKKERRNILDTLNKLDITIDIKITIYST